MAMSNQIIGTKWRVVANGKRALNGERHSVTREGDVTAADGDESVFDIASALVADIEPIMRRDLEIIDSIQFTIFPLNKQI